MAETHQDDDGGKTALYHPLDKGRQEIRLIRLEPASTAHECIQLELAVFSLNDEPEYTALSYCWGRDPAIDPVTINSKEHIVRPNLYAYLQVISGDWASIIMAGFLSTHCPSTRKTWRNEAAK
jgi:hypothetical protein